MVGKWGIRIPAGNAVIISRRGTAAKGDEKPLSAAAFSPRRSLPGALLTVVGCFSFTGRSAMLLPSVCQPCNEALGRQLHCRPVAVHRGGSVTATPTCNSHPNASVVRAHLGSGAMYYAMPILLANGPLPWLVGVLVLIVFAAIAAAIVFNYGGIWFRAYMSSANISLLSLIGMSFRRVDSRVIVLGKIMAVQAGIGMEKQTGVTTRRLGGPLSRRRQRAQRDQGDHRRPSGRHRPGLRPRRGHRPGRPRRARRRADQRLSQGDRLPRPQTIGHAPPSAPSPRMASS